MIKFKPLLAVLTVLVCMAAFFTLAALFPFIMFIITMSIALLALSIAVYQIADKHFNDEEETEEV